jgi:hypothetical protein
MPAMFSAAHKAITMEHRHTVYSAVVTPKFYMAVCLNHLARPSDVCIHAMPRKGDISRVENFSPQFECSGGKVDCTLYTQGLIWTEFAAGSKMICYHADIGFPMEEFLPFGIGVVNRIAVSGIDIGENLNRTCGLIGVSIYSSLMEMGCRKAAGLEVEETKWEVLCEREIAMVVYTEVMKGLLRQEGFDDEEKGGSPLTRLITRGEGTTSFKGFRVGIVEKDYQCDFCKGESG